MSDTTAPTTTRGYLRESARQLGERASASQLPLSGKEARRQLLDSLPMTQRQLTLAGISTSVLEGGARGQQPVVLLHGPGAYAAHWMRVFPQLVSDYRVIAPDLPGHGESPVTEGTLDATRIVDWVNELTANTCNSPAVVVAHLAGGAIAARFAMAHPSRVKQLVLVDTFGLAPFQPPPDFATALGQFLANPSEETHQDLWRYCAFDLDGLQQRMGKRWIPFAAYNVERAQSPEVKAAVGALIGQFGAAIPTEELAGIRVPTALIWGRKDLASPVAIAELASARYGWPLHVIENCADDPPVERPEDFVRALREALTS